MTPHFTFVDKMINRTIEKKSVLCVGLDPQTKHMPSHLIQWARSNYGDTFEAVGRLFLAFNKKIIDAIVRYATSVKPQIAFYEIYGQWGIWAYEETVAYAKTKGLIVITDGKRGDGGDTARAYAEGHLGEVPWWPAADGEPSTHISPLRADALTIHGYIGDDCVPHFVHAMKKHGTGGFVVTKTSFKPDSRIEQLRSVKVTELVTALIALVVAFMSGDYNNWRERLQKVVELHTRTVWQELAHLVNEWGEGSEGTYGWRNLGVVLGATKPDDAEAMRKILPKAWFLVPGYGTQGAGADAAVLGADESGYGVTVVSARAIIYAYCDLNGNFQGLPENFDTCAGEAAKSARDDLNAALLRAGKGKAFLQAP